MARVSWIAGRLRVFAPPRAAPSRRIRSAGQGAVAGQAGHNRPKREPAGGQIPGPGPGCGLGVGERPRS